MDVCWVPSEAVSSHVTHYQRELAEEGEEKSGYMLGASPSEAVSSHVACYQGEVAEEGEG